VFGNDADTELRIVMHILDNRFWTQVALRGSIGFSEAWLEGWVRIDHRVALVRMFVRNREVLDGMESGLARFALPFLKWWHTQRRNTIEGSRRNIAEHYDLGNDFYKLWLDETMMYSSGYWPRPEATLHEASVAKLDRICQKLSLTPDLHVLEIGTGWGGFALHAAGKYGCKVTTTTISQEQHRLATERVREAGLEDRVTVLLQDYRALEGEYDRLVSIEMIEAVGWQFFDTYHQQIARLLKPNGLALIQAITIADRHYETARKSVDFIQRYIFPGSCIPSLNALLQSATKSSDLTAVHIEDFGPHYAQTLAAWRRRFFDALPQVRELGFDDRFIRMWDWYLAYCEGGFAERQLGLAQIVWSRPEWRGTPLAVRLSHG
jgi:cyclopropane-fatty-acyl-phospholipid synthase